MNVQNLPALPTDPDWLDRQYNNRARVPEHVQHFQAWAARSAEARRTQTCHLDVPYGESPAETLDVFPARRPGAPVLVFIHGGWWRSLDKADHSFVAPHFVDAGACVVVPNYTLCPAITVPGIALQMTRALAWTWRHVARHGGDPSRIVVAGHSAGGHLTAMMLGALWSRVAPDLPTDLVKAGLSISGLYELASVGHTPHLAESLRLTPEQVAQSSPARFPAPGAAPLLTVVGGDESEAFLWQNAHIRRCWGARAVPVCEALPGLQHFSVLETLAEPGQCLHRLALGLLGLPAA